MIDVLTALVVAGIAAFTAFLCSIAAHFSLNYETRKELAHLKHEWGELNARISTAQKRSAAAASVQARAGALHPTDDAAVRAIAAGKRFSAPVSSDEDFPAWFDTLRK